MLKRYCDICKVELDKDEEVKEVKLLEKIEDWETLRKELKEFLARY